VATGIFLSRMTGLARERALGHFFGTGYAADAFTAASRIPNLLQNLLGEGVLSASMIPVYSRLLAEGREKEAGETMRGAYIRPGSFSTSSRPKPQCIFVRRKRSSFLW
jgi:peptidoglycan biosynthesis protein MviN/MurJ (putative lipid II flippase)